MSHPRCILVSSRKTPPVRLAVPTGPGQGSCCRSRPLPGDGGTRSGPRRWRLGAGPSEGSDLALFAFSVPPRPARRHGRHVPSIYNESRNQDTRWPAGLVLLTRLWPQVSETTSFGESGYSTPTGWISTRCSSTCTFSSSPISSTLIRGQPWTTKPWWTAASCGPHLVVGSQSGEPPTQPLGMEVAFPTRTAAGSGVDRVGSSLVHLRYAGLPG